jgi:hypothetical protein
MAREKRQWILVAGTGTLHLPDQVIWCAEALGTRLASGDYGLVTGGWQGVDHVTSRAFAEELIRRRENVLDRLVQVVKRAHSQITAEAELPTSKNILTALRQQFSVLTPWSCLEEWAGPTISRH